MTSVPGGPASGRAPGGVAPLGPTPRALAPGPAVRWRLVSAGLLGGWVVLGAAASPATAGGSLITVIDNSHADSLVSTDSLLEIDKAGNVQTGQGTAGSDHGPANALVGALVGSAPVSAVDTSAGSGE
ncbi:hypothetical protein [Kitasatospora sp. NPDC059327]|uniref:hypothetical protein n=1 Tax=Kitasatospora sp. NPDC059327 TaxID=3346803 RepID=UPI0036743FD9